MGRIYDFYDNPGVGIAEFSPYIDQYFNISALRYESAANVIDTDEVWTVAGSPYIVHASIFVSSQGSLTIEPGVSVYLYVGAGILAEGNITACGEPGKRINFTGYGWSTISVSCSHPKFCYCDFIGGGAGGDGLVALTNTETRTEYIEFFECTFQNSSSNGFTNTGSRDIKIEKCLFKDIDQAGSSDHVVKAGSSRIWILETSFINIGGGVLQKTSDGTRFENCIVRNSSAPTSLFTFTVGDDLVIVDSEFYDSSGYIHIDWFGWTTGIEISRNIFEGNNGYSDKLLDTWFIGKITMNNNTFRRNTGRLFIDDHTEKLEFEFSQNLVEYNVIDGHPFVDIICNYDYDHFFNFSRNYFISNVVNSPHLLYFDNPDISPESSFFEYNVLQSNIGTNSIIYLKANGMRIRGNMFGNPGTPYEIEAGVAGSTIDATLNWWGSEDETWIANERIFDFYDDSGVEVINFLPLMTGLETCDSFYGSDTFCSVYPDEGIVIPYCKLGYTQIRCNNTCFGRWQNEITKVCSGRGDCVHHDLCYCEEFYFGLNCNITECFGEFSNISSTCGKYGQCWPRDTCECIGPGQYYLNGIVCNLTSCSGVLSNESACSDHGTCWPFDVCSCDSNYYGEDCNVSKCNGLFSNESRVCNGRGTCAFFEQCVCNENYYGENCNVTTCYGEFSNLTSTCTEYGVCSEYGVCQCGNGYYGEFCNISECFGILSNTSETCSSKGECWPINTCYCVDHHYFGPECNYTWCNDMPTNESGYCSGKGSCWPYEHCNCIKDYFGVFCNITTCSGKWNNDSSVLDFTSEISSYSICNGHGICKEKDSCTCFPGYWSEECDITTCSDGFLTNDSSNVCSGHGNCDIFNLTCGCNYGYFNEFCDGWTCHLFDSSQYGVCSTHGDCISYDQCKCYENYTSENCGIFQCYGVWNNESNEVCSGHGNCLRYDDCDCDDTTYAGENCQFWKCYNVSASYVDSVCGGHGTCIDVDFCLCASGYSSEVFKGNCNIYFCGLHEWDESEVCSGRGECQASHNCECRDDYEGDVCETWSCGFDQESSLTCSGHGKCVSPNVCECSTGYIGDLCDTDIITPIILIPILSLASLAVLVFFLLFLMCVICCACICVCVICCLCCFLCLQRMRTRKFYKLKNFDQLLLEQELDEDSSVAHIRVDHGMFEIPMNEVKLLEILGEGGSSSVVYKASWKNQVVAFKCFKTRLVCNNQDNYDEFERECTVLGSVSHPNIIRFFGASLEPPRVGILMEYCENGDMEVFILKYKKENGKRYPVREKLRMCFETALPLRYLHDRNIIHRDLKLENVLIDLNERCKLMDFGLSRIVDRMSSAKTSRIGTSIYMSPEITQNSVYTESVDVFSFAVMLFVVFTENFSPYGKDERHVELKVASNPSFRPDIEELRNCLPSSIKDWLCEVTEKCWDNDPSERIPFQNICELFKEKLDSFDDVDASDDLEKKTLEPIMGDVLEKRILEEEEEEELGNFVPDVEVEHQPGKKKVLFQKREPPGEEKNRNEFLLQKLKEKDDIIGDLMKQLEDLKKNQND